MSDTTQEMPLSPPPMPVGAPETNGGQPAGTDTALQKLRAPFSEEVVGKLPPTEKRPIELDYVGHATVTDRLLSVDPEWTWEPFAVDNDGLPAFDRSGGLWIRLTICGVTRIGYGDASGQVQGPKVVIGDAIRNAAMRFGVGLDLWSRDELESLIGNETVTKRRRAPRSSTPPPNGPPAAASPQILASAGVEFAGAGTEQDHRRTWPASWIPRSSTPRHRPRTSPRSWSTRSRDSPS